MADEYGTASRGRHYENEPLAAPAGSTMVSDRYCDDPERHGFPCLCAAGSYATYWTMAACGGDATWPYRPRPQLPAAMLATSFMPPGFTPEPSPPPPLADRVDPSMPAWLAKAGSHCKASETFRQALSHPVEFESGDYGASEFMSRWERRMTVTGLPARPWSSIRLSSVV